MIQNVKVLNAKLMVPLTADTIERERIRPLASGIPQKKITVVSAGAGYGKTTLISQAVQGFDTVWYRLDSLDRDLIIFLSHLVAGIAKHYPGFGREASEQLKQARNLGLEFESVLSVFLHELEQALERDIMIVLDDFHAVQDTPLIRDAMQFIVDRICPFVHLIIISRTEIPLQLSRLKSLREVLDVRTTDLLFTAEEIRQLFDEVFHITLAPGSLESIRRKTQGWISGLILFFHALSTRAPEEIDGYIHRIKGSGRLISEYLEENVYSLLPPDTKRFLLRTSFLSRLNAGFCDRLLHITNSGEMLRSLSRGHLFTFVLDEDGQEYTYHHLFQEFLQTLFEREVPEVERTRLHLEAARLLEDAGDDDASLRHLLLAGSFEKVCSILEEKGMFLINSGRIELINSYIEKIPEQVIREHPWIRFLRMTAQDPTGTHPEALGQIEHALEQFRADRNQAWIDRSLNEMAMRFSLTGEVDKAEELFKGLLKNDELDPLLKVETHGHLIFITAHLGRLDEADEYYSSALPIVLNLEKQDLRNGLHAWLLINHGFRHVFSSDLAEAIDLGLKARELLRGTDAQLLLGLTYFVVSSAQFFNSSFDEGLATALEGLSPAKKKGYRDISEGWIFCFAGLNALGLGKIEDGLGYAREGLEVFKVIGTRFGQAYAYHVMQEIYRLSGMLEASEEAGRTGLDMIKGLTLPVAAGPIKASLADILILKGNLDEAAILTREAESEPIPSKIYNYRVGRLRALLEWRRGCKEKALKAMVKALTIAQTNRFDRWALFDLGQHLPMLVELYARGNMEAYILDLFNTAGSGFKSALTSLRKTGEQRISEAASSILKSMQDASTASLEVKCLGKFEVFRSGEEILPREWKSRKARMLFKLLVYYRRDGYVNKEVFMEHLWPEADPVKSAKSFHVALTSLRRTLEPDHQRGLPSAYLKSDGDAYLLDLSREGCVDADSFEQACRDAAHAPDGEQAIGYLLEAERVYLGAYLAGDLYETWCAGERERLSAMHLSVLAGIADYFESKQDYEKAAEYCNKYLGIDPYAEDMYQALMRLYSLLGNKAMGVKTYERCRENIVDGLGCSVSRETELLAKELLDS